MRLSKSILFILAGFYFILCACTKNPEFVLSDKLEPDAILKIVSVQPSVAIADSSTLITIRVSINSKADSAIPITLTTSAGIINGKSTSETLPVNLNRYCDFILRTGQNAGPVSLRATLFTSYFRDTTILLGMAYPDIILINPESATIAQNTTLNVPVQLLRYNGFASKDQTLVFSATDNATNNPSGVFKYTQLFAPGAPISATYTPASNFTGNITLHVDLYKKDGTKMSAQYPITVQ